MDEDCRDPQQLKLHMPAGLVRAVGDLLIASFSPMDYFHGQGDLSLLALGLARGWPLSDGGTGGFSHGARVQESDTHRVVIQPESEVKALTE